VRDTMIITVSPPVLANAGRDTAILPSQPLQLNATGGSRYTWSPEWGMNDPSISNPVVILDDPSDSITYRVRVYSSEGCYADDDIIVRFYRSEPEILVPSAFTPNSDGKNDILRPITLGITTLHYFRVYNRWGQLLYTSTETGTGWDGTHNGVKQPGGAYVYTAEGKDFRGKTIYRKGTAVLIR
ncbi:MAG: cell surface protein, partial [Sediminibacterium sp.]|nr:cell surface protein [Sediminibacterium sp.]